MKYILLFFIIICNSVFAEFDYSRYRIATIDEAIENLSVDPRADYYFEAGSFKYSSLVKYTGVHRNTIKETQDFIQKWVKTLGHPKEYAELFPFEVEFEQNGNFYWLPIQETLVQPFADEVQANGTVKLFIMTAGAVNQRPIFLINEFQAK